MMLPRMHASPMPMYTTSGLDSETATAPTDELLIWPSVTGFHESPPSTVFHNPPPTAPKYASRGRPFTPDTAMDRPPRSGPMLRQRKALAIALSMSPADDPVCRAPACARMLRPAEASRTDVQRKNEIRLIMPRSLAQLTRHCYDAR